MDDFESESSPNPQPIDVCHIAFDNKKVLMESMTADIWEWRYVKQLTYKQIAEKLNAISQHHIVWSQVRNWLRDHPDSLGSISMPQLIPRHIPDENGEKVEVYVDDQNKPIAQEDLPLCGKYLLDNIPYVLNPETPKKYDNAKEFEKDHGAMVRNTVVYEGLSHKALASTLARRRAVLIAKDKPGQWIDCPILVSHRTLRTWNDKYGKRGALRTPTPKKRTHVTSEMELETCLGDVLRRYMALGFRGRRNIRKYAMSQGIACSEMTSRNWELQMSHRLPNSISTEKLPAASIKTRVQDAVAVHKRLGCSWPKIVAYESEVHDTSVNIRRLYQHVKKEEPLMVVKYWQQLLQEPLVSELQWIKDVCDDPTMRWSDGTHYSEEAAQDEIMIRMSKKTGFQVNLRPLDMLKVWNHVCKEHGAIMGCRVCLYTFPIQQMALKQPRNDIPTWRCKECIANSGLCRAAAGLSERPEYHQNFGFGNRPTKWPVLNAALRKSANALYEVRKAASAIAPLKSLGRWQDASMPDHEIKDEFFYAHGYDVPKPRVLQQMHEKVVKRARMNGA